MGSGSTRITVYIDGANLHRASIELGYAIEYKKFRGWLRQKYKTENVYLFIGFLPNKINLYRHLQQSVFMLVFKQTVLADGTVKGNCDAELVLQATSDFYENRYDKCIVLTGDGDFGCLVEFLAARDAIDTVIAPSKRKCSFLLRNKNTNLLFLDDLYHKFSQKVKI